MIKVGTFCSGIGSPEAAIKDLGIEHENVFACDIDQYAREAYNAIHTTGFMFNDMTEPDYVDSRLYADLVVGGIPCQAFSLAGKRLGELDKRGLLFYDFYRYIKNQQPKVFIIENVKGLLSDNNGKTFQNWIALLGQSINTHFNIFNHEDSLMYNLHFTVLNSKDFGVPQNRERVFLVGVRNDLPNKFHFPAPVNSKVTLRDILEPEVDERYFLTAKQMEGLNIKNINDITEEGIFLYKKRRTEEGKAIRRKTGTNPNQASEVLFHKSDYMNCLTTEIRKEHFVIVREATEKGFSIAYEGDSINLSNPNSETRRGRVGDGISNTLDTSCNQAVFIKNRVRKLTPLECWRLQGFDDVDYYKAAKTLSDRQLYKRAGNSMTKHVMKAIIKNTLPVLYD